MWSGAVTRGQSSHLINNLYQLQNKIDHISSFSPLLLHSASVLFTAVLFSPHFSSPHFVIVSKKMEILPLLATQRGVSFPDVPETLELGGLAISPGFGSDHPPSDDQLQGESQRLRSSATPNPPTAVIPGASLRSLVFLHRPADFSEKRSSSNCFMK